MAEKIAACGVAVRIDFGDGDGFQTQGLTDSITPWPRTKTVIDTPDFDCDASSSVGREEQSTLVFGQYWDAQDSVHNKVDLNFEDSKTDKDKLEVTVQLVWPSYKTTGALTSAIVTEEAPCQIASIEPEELSPEGHFKRNVTLVRTGAITKTVV